MEQGGVRIDGEKVESSKAVITPGPARLFQVGKRGFLRIEVVRKKS
jgi:tyrosyl-tRNA synthetase